jgi:hypothetical protein
MVARLRTNVLKREEKGFGPVSFPRILLAGIGGVTLTLGFSKVIGFIGGCVCGFFATVLIIFLTQPVSGTPMAQYLAKLFRGMLIVGAIKAESGERSNPIINFLVQTFNINTADGIVDCAEIFNATIDEDDDEHPATEMVFFRDITDLDQKGLQVIENPFVGAD